MLDYIEWKKSTTKNPHTATHYLRWVQRFHAITQKTEAFTLEDFGTFKRVLVEMGYSSKNIQYGLYLVRDYLSYLSAVHNLRIPLKLLKITQERSKSHHPITREEYGALISLLPPNEPYSLQKRLMLVFLWETGMRAGELLRLRISELQPRSAIITNEKNPRNRLIGWSMEAERLLQRYLTLRKHLPSKEDYVFVSFYYRPCRRMTTRQLERIVLDLRKKAALKNPVRPHSFRHGFVHRQLEKRTPITTIAQMLGHSSTANVMTYAQLSSREIKDAWEI